MYLNTEEILQIVWKAQGPLNAEEVQAPSSPDKLESPGKADPLGADVDDKMDSGSPKKSHQQKVAGINIPHTVIFKQGHMEDWFFFEAWCFKEEAKVQTE
mmetsp:Transcript_44140/g.117742  ORF Transcript_44140/g.117742 Transcript_44140/m.117742 type:complete len:100 (-) Transcript_44140:483-782(-)